ncbi:ChaN family lipoprotein [Pseudomonas aegrilactucae]|uniref:ChaN family lipoprotein n=1 Tax=Pseudomonas aegrilactucae TaxID=2854028 RepID=A0A9Q3AF63_9PSED|nr:ChaN family lipoprotein [Pseudomonas aegrilactucae]MBV6288723.1 ChaN family lipoprotein [Pseudomonas aegrilactucae]
MSLRTLRGSVLLLLAAVVCGCQAGAQLPALPELPAWQSPQGREDARLGQIQDLRTGQLLSPAQLVERLAAATRVLVGEQHDNPDHHALQLWLLRALEQRRPQGSVLLEMLEPAQQGRVDTVKAHTALPADLQQALGWPAGWDWNLYGPIVRHALAQPYPLLAANLDRSEVREIYRQKPTLEGPRSTAQGVTAALLEQVREGHCGLLPESQMPAMLAVQQQRDRRIAQQLMQAPAPAMLLAGAYHVRKDMGVPLHLEDLGAASGTEVVMLAQVGAAVEPGMADFVWFTAALVKRDYCADLRKGE